MNKNFDAGIALDTSVEENSYGDLYWEALTEFSGNPDLAMQAIRVRLEYGTSMHAEYIKSRIEQLGLNG